MVKMGFTNIFPVLAVFVIFYFCEVNSSKKNAGILNVDLPQIVDNAEPVSKAGYIVQQITTKIRYVGQVHYDLLSRQIISFDREVNASLYGWNMSSGLEGSMYIKELSEEKLATIMPVEKRITRMLTGSDRNIRYYESINKTDYYISEPVVHFDDPGFIIYSSHCDSNGYMYTLLIGETQGTKKLGKLYRVINDTATLIRSFNTKPRDFRFNADDTVLYIVHDNGRKIQKIPFNTNTTLFGSPTDIFDKDKHPELKDNELTSLVPDKRGYLWVSAAGNEGLVLEINPFNGTLVSKTPVPSKDLTFITFGLVGFRTLLVGSKKTCRKGISQGAIYGISGMGVKGVPDFPVKYKNYENKLRGP